VLIRGLAQALADQGHDVHLVAYPYGENLVAVRRIFIHRTRVPRFVRAVDRIGWRKIILDVCLMWTLYRVVRRERIQVIHAHNYEGPLIGYLVRAVTGVPVVYHSHNALSDELVYYFKGRWRRVARWVGQWLDRQVPRRADFSIALTPELEGFLRAHGVPEDRVATIPPVGAPAAVLESAANGGEGFGSRFVVMYAGNLDPYQDLDVLARGFEIFRQHERSALLAVVTHEANWLGRIDAHLERLVQSGEARVIVAPAFSVVRRLLAVADVLVCPRSSWSGFPIKLINYMAAGRPVVAAEGSAKGIVDEETGLVFRNRDAQALAAALRRLSGDAALRRRLGERAQAASSAAPGWTAAIAQILRVYAQVGTRPASDGRHVLLQRARRSRTLMVFSRDRMSAASGDRSA
jgi:1,2-diacylglycerol 3-alpha-glucosyltransferase